MGRLEIAMTDRRPWNELRAAMDRAAPRLRDMSDAAAAEPLRPGGWSPKQVIGHLIDSASNNHQRFVRARFVDALRFPGYDQNAWVEAQGYGEAPWRDLLALWESFNRQLASVMERASAEELEKKRTDHNLDLIAWEIVPAEESVTLLYFMRDYVGHLQHHLRQIDTGLAAEPTLQRA